MKVKWVELTEDDPIFNQGFIISSPIKKRPKNEAKKQNNEKKDKIKSQNKKRGIKSPYLFLVY